MLNKIKYALYYLIFFNLPNGRYIKLATQIRVLYVSKVLKLTPYHENTRIQNNVYLSGPDKVTIGLDCQINEHVFIQGARIGDNVMIAPYVSVLCNVKKTEDVGVPMNHQGWAEREKMVVIHDNVWIGRNAILMPGVVVNSGAIVGAGSVVTRDVPKNAVAAGSPAKVIRYRE